MFKKINSRKIYSRLIMTVLITMLLAGSVLAAGAEVDNPKYVIFLIGDGMSSSQATLAEYYNQFENLEEFNHNYEEYGESFIDMTKENHSDRLMMHRLDHEGSTRTTGSFTLVPGSAQTATALATGAKTDRDTIALDLNDKPLKSILMASKNKGMATGLVSTARITHATPASFGSNVPDRGMENEIAAQYLENEIDYLVGGGARHFLPGNNENSKREDDRNLFEEFANKGYEVFESNNETAAFRDYKPQAGDQVLYTPTMSHVSYEIDRDNELVPSIAEMTKKGIELLSQDEDGFFMMVEGGRIDHAAHDNDVAATIHDTLAFDDAVKTAYKFYLEHPNETLIIVAGDHETGGLGLNSSQGMEYDYFMDLAPIREIKASIEEGFEYTGDREKVYADLEADFGIEELSAREKELLESAMDLQDAEGKGADVDEFNGYWPQATWISPVQSTIAHITSRRSRIGWTSSAHTGQIIPIRTHGVGAARYTDSMDNTDVAKITAELLELELN
jgi:alkaline phosphatase